MNASPDANAAGSAGTAAGGPVDAAPAAPAAPVRAPCRAPLPAASERAGVPALRRLDTEQLLQGEREVLIQHGSSVYRLRQTALGKLILTK